MTDNNTFQKENIDDKPKIELSPIVTDLCFKILRKIGIPNIIIDESVYYAIDPQKKPEDALAFFRCDISNQIGEGVQLYCHLEQESFKLMNHSKGNYNLSVYDFDDSRYKINNGDFHCFIRKIPFENIKQLLPDLTNAVRLNTTKCKHFKNAIGKVEYVDIFIVNNQITAIQPSKPNIIMSFDPLLTTEVFNGKPDLVFRSQHFFRLTADEVELLITVDKGNFWLCTRIKFTQDILIEQFEPLKVVE